MDESFLAALFPRRHRILGRRLRPYCYGHFAALLAAGSPFLAPEGSGAVATAGDVLSALRICSAPGHPFLAPDEFGPRWDDVVRRWWLGRRPERLRAVAQALRDYLDDYSQFPEFWEEESLSDPDAEENGLLADGGEGRKLTAPVALARVCALISRTTLTWEQAWRMPICLPVWVTACLDEMDGAKLRFIREADVDGRDLPPEPELTEKQLYAQAVRHLGREQAGQWWKARKAAARRGKRRNKKGSL